MRIPIIALSTLLGLAGITMESRACSVFGDYKVPTSIELAEKADIILLARAIEEVPNKDDYELGVIKLVPEFLISGSVMPTELTIRGYFDTDRLKSTSSNPNELAEANPDAFWGGCNRYVFRPGMLLLLFVERDESGAWNIISHPFARTAEDVPDQFAPWVRAISFYASIAKLPKSERKSKLITERERLLATGDATDALLARDINRQLKGKRTQNYD